MRPLYSYLVVLFIFLLSSCENKTTNELPYPSFSEYKRPPTHVDSIVTNTPATLKSSETVTFNLTERVKVGADFQNFASKNTSALRNIDTVKVPDLKIIEHVKPFVTKAVPYISKVYHSKPIKAGELRSTGSSNENIMYLDVEQGLPVSNIRDIKEDPKGFLWLATSGAGLLKYDGYYITAYTAKNGFPSSDVSKIIFGPDSTLWMTSSNGLINFDGNSFKIYNEKSGLTHQSIADILFDSKKNLWIATHAGGVYKLKDGLFYNYTKEHGLNENITCIALDSLNRIFVGSWCAHPDFIINDSTIGKSTSVFPYGSECAMTAYTDYDKNLWLGSYNGGGVNLKNKISIRHHPQTGIHYVNIHAFLRDSKGKMWLGTNEGGLVRIDENNYTFYTTREGLSSNKITCITEDSKNNIWVGTEGGGICRIKQGSFRSYGLLDGFTDKNVIKIYENYKGDILFGTWANGLWSFNGSRFLHFTHGHGLNGNIILSILEDKNNHLHLTYHQHGYAILKPSSNDSVPYDTSYFLSYTNGFGNHMSFNSTKGKDGTIWITDLRQGLTKYNYNSFEKFDTEHGLSSKSIYAVTTDKNNTIWLGTANCGISRIDKNVITHFTKKEGLPANEIRCMFVSHDNMLWIGTPLGLAKFDGKTFTVFDNKDGLSVNNVTSITEDKKHRLWVGTFKGLNLLIPDSNSKKGYLIESFTVQDGLKSIEFLSNSVLLDSKNNLWWGTRKDVVKLNLNEFESKNISPQVYLSQINLMENYINYNALKDSCEKKQRFYVSDSSVNLSEVKFKSVAPYFNLPLRLELPYYINSVSFNFYSFSGSPTHRIKYRYKLSGYNESWVESNLPEAKFTNLNHGKYSFEVQAKSEGLNWGEKTTYEFDINPPFWHTWWFRVFSIIMFVGIITGIFKWRNKQLLERQARLEETVNERTKEINHQKLLIEEKQKEIVDSINYARRIQYTLLAHDEILKQNLNDFFVLFAPKDIVSGDFYWAIKKDSRFYLCLGDSTGHGVPGAFMSLLNISFLNEAINEKNIHEPNQIFNYVREKLISHISYEGQQDGMDGILICIEKDKITYASANNKPVIIRSGNLVELPTDKMPVGKSMKTDSFNLYSIPKQPDDILYLFTDGFSDQFGGEKGKKFKYKQLHEKFTELANINLNDQKAILEKTFIEWKGNLEQVDDVCVIGVRL